MAHTYGNGKETLYRGKITILVEDGKCSVVLRSTSHNNDVETERELKTALCTLEETMNGMGLLIL